MSAAIATRVERERFGPFDVRVWRFGAGAPLVYLHGFESHPGDATFLQRLGERRRVHAPEHPGWGESTGFEAVQDLFDVVLFYRRFVESLGDEPVDVVGHGLGGMFAAELAAIAPRAVRRLVLVSPMGLWLPDAPAADPFTLSPAAFAKAKWHDPAAAARETTAWQESDGVGAQAYRTQNLAAATKFLWPLPDRGTRRRLIYVAAPTLVLQGASDGLVPPAYGDAWARAIAGARLETIAGAGHVPMVEAEDATHAAITTFLG